MVFPKHASTVWPRKELQIDEKKWLTEFTNILKVRLQDLWPTTYLLTVMIVAELQQKLASNSFLQLEV